MGSTLDLLTAIFLLLGFAVLAGEVASHLGHVALVGQVAVGVILGPTLLGPYLGLSMTDPVLGAPLQAIQTIAVFFILFMAGLEVVPEDIWNNGAAAGVLGVSIFLGPFLIGAWIVPLVFGGGLPLLTTLFISLTLSITALPVMAVILIELGLIRTRLGSLVMGAAVVNELAAMTTFALLLQFNKGNVSALAVTVSVLEVALFIGTVLTVHQLLKVLRLSRWWVPLHDRLAGHLRKRSVWFAVLMVMAISSSLLSEALGLTYLVGAFYAGLLVTRESAGPVAKREIGQVFNTMTWGFFIPLFFAFVGLNMNLRTLLSPSVELIFVGLLLLACFPKLALGGLVAKLLGMPSRQCLAIASLVNGRGAVELAIATILLGMGIFNVEIFSLVAAVGLVTTIMAPIGVGALGLTASELSPPTPAPPATSKIAAAEGA